MSHRFRLPMDADSIRKRLSRCPRNGDLVYELAVTAAGHPSAFTTDKLSKRLPDALSHLIADMAVEIEKENE